MKSSSLRIGLGLVLICVSTLPALAQAGRRPIWQPTTITVPGQYVVTRNLVAIPGGVIIEIAAPDVDIDLNGMELVQPDPSLPAIVGSAPADFRIHDGTILGGSQAITNNFPGPRVTIERLHAAGQSGDSILLLDVSSVAIRHSTIHDATGAAIRLDGGAPKAGVIEHNEILRTGDGVAVRAGQSLTLQHNRIQDLTAAGGGNAILLEDSSGVLVSNNVCQRVASGVMLRRGNGCKLYNNVVSGAFGEGIHIDPVSGDNLLKTNVVSSATLAGIAIYGFRNHLEDNLSNSSTAWGVLFAGGSGDNVYKANVARGNTGPLGCFVVSTPDFCDSGVGNTTAGDNFLPFPGM